MKEFTEEEKQKAWQKLLELKGIPIPVPYPGAAETFPEDRE